MELSPPLLLPVGVTQFDDLLFQVNIFAKYLPALQQVLIVVVIKIGFYLILNYLDIGNVVRYLGLQSQLQAVQFFLVEQYLSDLPPATIQNHAVYAGVWE